MRKLKRWLCFALAGVFITGTPADVIAKEWNQNQIPFTMDVFNPLKKTELPEVTEEQVAEFERTFDSKAKILSALSGSQTEEGAKKRASIITSLYGVTSLQYAVIQDGAIVLSNQEGYKNRVTQSVPNKNTMYGVASISKMFTTVAVMQLVEEGILELDTPVVTYLPEFKTVDKRYKDITIRMLLNHSSGLMGGTLNSTILLGDNASLYHDKFLKQQKKLYLQSDPGAYSVYSNDGFTLAELVVEKVTGKSFSAYIAENITNPLGMNHTKTPVDDFKTSQMARIYENVEAKKSLPVEMLNAIGAGGIISTAEDLCRLATLFMNGNPEVLSAQSAKLTQEEEYKRGLWTAETSGIMDFGLGWDSVNAFPFSQYGIKALVKGGDSVYYHSSLIVLPEKNLAVAITSVGGSSSINQIFGQSILLDLMEEQKIINEIIPAPEKEIPVKAKMPEELQKYEGYYGNYSGVVKIQIKDDSLIIANAYDLKNTVSYVYTEDGTFKDMMGAEALSFVTEKNGEVYLKGTSYGALPGIGDTYLNMYQVQKMEDNPISKSVKKAWEERKGKRYFIINERYSSVLYFNSMIATVDMVEGMEGYFGNAKITGKDTAMPYLQIPGSGSRDIRGITFYKKNGIEYLNSNGLVAVEEKAVKNLSAKETFTVTIGKEAGYTKWYKVGKTAANKKIKITCPAEGTFWIVDKDGNPMKHSYTSGTSTIKLPKDGFVVFAGEKGKKFAVKYVK